jgi:hypothetical protein
MKTRSQNKFTVADVEAAKALLQLKKAVFTNVKTSRADRWPSGRPRRSTAGHVDYREQE